MRSVSRSLWNVSLALVVVVFGAEVARAQWSENFDSYASGSTVAGQGDWAGWDQTAGIDADVTDEQASSPPNSLRLRTDSDMVAVYSGVSGGQWTYRAMTYIPSGHTGETWFILLNTYAHGGAKNWSTQLVMRNGQVESGGGSGFGGGGSLPLIQDQWVELKVDIDLDANTQTISYGGQMLDQTPWQASGIAEVQAVDLFSNNGSAAYFDDLSLSPAEAPPAEAPALSAWGALTLVLLALLGGTLALSRRRQVCLDH